MQTNQGIHCSPTYTTISIYLSAVSEDPDQPTRKIAGCSGSALFANCLRGVFVLSALIELYTHVYKVQLILLMLTNREYLDQSARTFAVRIWHENACPSFCIKQSHMLPRRYRFIRGISVSQYRQHSLYRHSLERPNSLRIMTIWLSRNLHIRGNN